MNYFNRFALLFLSVVCCVVSMRAQAALDSQVLDLIKGAKKQIGVTVTYNPAYKVIPYPNGDVPAKEGVCTDVIIRAFRDQGIDLQKLIHEDIKANKSKYPNLWKLAKADPNIDHRRVPNLMVLLQSVASVVKKSDARPGDIVVWDVGGGREVLHIGVLSDQMKGRVPFAIHNIGWGVKEEDVLNSYKIITMYRFSSDAIQKLKALDKKKATA
jgi:uncharacterized protein YijF (DUF1287 family)